MRKLLFSLLLVAALSCKKEESSYEGKIVGTWELRKTDGGITGAVYYPVGNGELIRFKNNRTYERLLVDSVYESGSYTLTSSTVAKEWILTLVSSSSAVVETVSVKATELIFRRPADCCDIMEITYEKL